MIVPKPPIFVPNISDVALSVKEPSIAAAGTLLITWQISAVTITSFIESA